MFRRRGQSRGLEAVGAHAEGRGPCARPLALGNGQRARPGRAARAHHLRSHPYFLGLLETLPVCVDHATTASAWHDTLALAPSHGLTVYDAAYLELALRRGLPLASRDKALQAAARREGVPLLPS
ncbi:MAG: type II toxin-antitoxin system VapC family toxin [Synechococcaceae cyanobacterium]